MIYHLFVGALYVIGTIAAVMLIRYLFFRLLNIHAYREYYDVCTRVHNKNVPSEHSAFIAMNQSLQYCYVHEGMRMHADKDALHIDRTLRVVSPYACYLNSKRRDRWSHRPWDWSR